MCAGRVRGWVYVSMCMRASVHVRECVPWCVSMLLCQATATRARAAGASLKQFDALEGGAMDGTIRDPLLDKFDKWEKEGK